MKTEQCSMYANCVEIFGMHNNCNYVLNKMCNECPLKIKLQLQQVEEKDE